jgi:hypothetical protein
MNKLLANFLDLECPYHGCKLKTTKLKLFLFCEICGAWGGPDYRFNLDSYPTEFHEKLSKIEEYYEKSKTA